MSAINASAITSSMSVNPALRAAVIATSLDPMRVVASASVRRPPFAAGNTTSTLTRKSRSGSESETRSVSGLTSGA